LTAAIDLTFLRSNGINYIITVDSCPLPEIILDLRDINVKYIQGKCIFKINELIKIVLNSILYIIFYIQLVIKLHPYYIK